MKIRRYRPADREQLVSLWHECRLISPKNDPDKDIERKMKVKTGWLFIGEENSIVVASVMVGYEGHRGWINYLAVKPGFQRMGFGRKMMERAETELMKAGCPKINLQVRKENRKVLKFYKRLGYSEDAVISLGKRLQDDSREERSPPPKKAIGMGISISLRPIRKNKHLPARKPTRKPAE